MKDLIMLAREQPAAFWLLVLVLFSTGTGSGYISKALGQDDVKAEMVAYTDEQVGGVRKDMQTGFDSLSCTLLHMQKKMAQSELYGLEERENESPNADRRRRIKELRDEISVLSDIIRGCNK